MKKIAALLVVLIASAFTYSGFTVSAQSSVEAGKKLVFDRKLGNCMACHIVEDADFPGNIAPPIVAMKARFPDRATLELQIYDATVKNPQSMMPPFGKHGILSKAQIAQIVDYLYTL